MFTIDEENTISITRGDVGTIEVRVDNTDGGNYIFQPGDIVRLKVFNKKQHSSIVLVKEVTAEVESDVLDIVLEPSDTTIGGIINKPVDYWYEVELNPYTIPQTVVGYDADGAKIFRLYPEGGVAK